MKKRKSIHDLAKDMKISAATISFVINGRAREKRISKELEERVLKYVKETGYQPSVVAQTLRTGKSMILGILVEDISDPFFAAISRNIETAAYKLGYKIFFFSTENNTEKTRELIKIMRDRQVDGYIIAPPPGIEREVRELQEDNIPVVLFDRYFQTLETNNIIIDNFDGSYNAISYLVENGYTNICIVTLESEQTQMADRLRGYNKAMCEKGLEVYIRTIPYNQDEASTSKMVKTYLEEHVNIDAILFTTNYLLVAGLRAIAELGLEVPNDIAVIGFDDNSYFNLFKPSITAVSQPINEISTAILKKLMECLLNPSLSTAKSSVVLKTRLIVRDSCKRTIHSSIVATKEVNPISLSA